MKLLVTSIFALELLILALPVTGLALFAMLHLPGKKNPSLVAILLGYIGLIGFWLLALSFLFGGSKNVKRKPILAWLPATIGALMSTAALLTGLPTLAGKPPIEMGATIQPLIMVGACGVPLLIPLAHILICSWGANNSSRSRFAARLNSGVRQLR